MSETPKNLATKLSEIMVEVDRIAKRGRNDFHKYDYATESDITAAIREHLASRHIIILPRVRKWSTQEKPGEKGGVLAFVDMTFSIVDGESGETFECDWLGCGEDKGDKAVYKAFTGALKYFALKLFWIPTGDDPEREGKDKGKGKRQQASEPAEEPQSQQEPMGSDAAAILFAASELVQVAGKNIDHWVEEASKYQKDGKSNWFSATDLERGKLNRNPRWLKMTRERIEGELIKRRSANEPGAAEAAKLFDNAPF